MTTKQIAERLVDLCRKGQILEAQEELFADNAVSIEPDYSPLKSAKGKAAIAEKGRNFAAIIEERHGGSFSDPIVGGKYFTIAMTLDATLKGAGRTKVEEICLYEVHDGKIIREEFLF